MESALGLRIVTHPEGLWLVISDAVGQSITDRGFIILGQSLLKGRWQLER